jgi:hypothetical protein
VAPTTITIPIVTLAWSIPIHNDSLMCVERINWLIRQFLFEKLWNDFIQIDVVLIHLKIMLAKTTCIKKVFSAP